MCKLNDSLINSNVIWFFRNICIPFTLSMVLYKIIDKIQTARQKGTLNGKVVLITGASSGLGESLAHCFYDQGCKVILAARRKEQLDKVKNDILSKKMSMEPPVVLPLDLSDYMGLKEIIDNVYDQYGNIDILINNGGISNRGNILNTSLDVDLKLMSVNYFGTVALTKAVLSRMVEQKQGHIVFVSSIQGRIAIPDRSAYAASKHAMQAFADSLRAEVDQYNIKVSVISPGYINTSLSLNALTASGDKYGVQDTNTASGYSPDYVANIILNAVIKEMKEVILSPVQPRFAIFLRYFIPSLYFWLMAKRATKL